MITPTNAWIRYKINENEEEVAQKKLE